MGGTITDVATYGGVLSDHGHAAAERRRHESAPATRLQHIDKWHIRPFLTHHKRGHVSRSDLRGGGIELLPDGEISVSSSPAAAATGSAPEAGVTRQLSGRSEQSISDSDEDSETVVRAPALDVHYHQQRTTNENSQHGHGHTEGAGSVPRRRSGEQPGDDERFGDALETLGPSLPLV